jgi:pimeloyl-ACP methyl ester carboxylesterase
MSTFALVHGAWHGSWCWEHLTPELQAMGHRVIAMDLPIDDSSASFDDYADVVCAAVAGAAGEDLILVGHSLAGQTVSLVAARRPLRRLVYLCAMPPIPGTHFIQQIVDEPDMLHPDYTQALARDSEGRFAWIDKQMAHFHLYGDCDEPTTSAAFARLRPQATRPYRQPCSLTAMPAVESTYVVCDEDRIVMPEWSRRIAHEWLNAELIEMPGSHSPFLSRPEDLAEVLNGLK